MTGSHTVLLYVNGNVENSYTSRTYRAQLRKWSLCEPVGSSYLSGIVARPARTVHCGGYATGKSPDGLNTAWIIAIIAVAIVVAFVTRA
jgi:hypothetical protein